MVFTERLRLRPKALHRLKWATASNLRYRLMNSFDVLRDSLYFFKRNLGQIVRLCLPLVIFEALLQQVVDHSTEPDSFPGISVMVGLLVYPLYTAALILFLDARSRGESPRNRDLLSRSAYLWPRFAVLTALNTLLILIGLSLYFLPGIWLMVTLAFGEYLAGAARHGTAGGDEGKPAPDPRQLSAHSGVHSLRNGPVVGAQGRDPGGLSRTAERGDFPADRQRSQLPAAVRQRGAVPLVHVDRRGAREN